MFTESLEDNLCIVSPQQFFHCVRLLIWSVTRLPSESRPSLRPLTACANQLQQICHFWNATFSFSPPPFGSLYPSHSLQRWLIFSQRLRVSRKKNKKKNNNAELKWTPSLLLFSVLHPLPRSFSLLFYPNHRAGEGFQNNSWIEVIQGRVGVESDKDKWVNREYIMDRHSLTLHIFNM